MYVWACVTSSDTNIMERRCGQYSVMNCRCDVGLSVRCFRLPSSNFHASIFEDRCVDLRRTIVNVSTFEDRWSMCRSTFNDRCEIMLLYLLKRVCTSVLSFQKKGSPSQLCLVGYPNQILAVVIRWVEG